jgi:FMN phosphatase YigB (HAD superfamily)
MKFRFIDNYEVILLDMGNTFMFGTGRFGEGEDYHATYSQLGGHHLSADEVDGVIASLYDRMHSAGSNPARYDDFGDVRRFLNEPGAFSKLPPSEIQLIVEVVSQHEVGSIPETHAEAIHLLSKTHPLGIVSNIWSPPDVFEKELSRSGIIDHFSARVWSSDYLSIKPSPILFKRALDIFGVNPARALYVGDNPLRDIAGAKAAGMAAVWIENKTKPFTSEIPEPDLVISDLTLLPFAENECKTEAEERL